MLLKVLPFSEKENILNAISFPDDNSCRGGNPFQKAFVSFPLHRFNHSLLASICLFLIGIEFRLVRKGDGNRTILLLIPLSVVLFGLIGMGVTDLEPVNKNSQSYHGMKHKMPFIHTVAVPERVAV